MNQSYNSYKGFGSPSTVYRPLLSPAHSSQNHRLAPRSCLDRFPLFPHSWSHHHQVEHCHDACRWVMLWIIYKNESTCGADALVLHGLMHVCTWICIHIIWARWMQKSEGQLLCSITQWAWRMTEVRRSVTFSSSVGRLKLLSCKKFHYEQGYRWRHPEG